MVDTATTAYDITTIHVQYDDDLTNAARLVQLGVAESFDARPGRDEITADNLFLPNDMLIEHLTMDMV